MSIHLTLKRILYTKIVYPLIFLVLRLDVRSRWPAIADVIEDNSMSDEYIKGKLTALTKSDITTPLIEVERRLLDFPLLTKQDYAKRVVVSVKNSAIRRQTSGSSGVPNTFFYSKEAVSNQIAVRKYAYRKLGIDIGYSEARFWNIKKHNFKDTMKNLILNRRVFTFLENEKLELAKFNKMKPDYIYGYSSLILNSISVFKKYNVSPPKLKAVICTAEAVSDFQLEEISQFFNAPVAVEYGCTECDIIAYRFGLSPYKIINPNIIIESVENKVLITLLDNDIANLIRYDLGDELSFESDKKYYKAGDTIEQLLGRTQNRIIRLADGNEFHASEFSKLVAVISETIFPVHIFKVVLKNDGIIEFLIETRETCDSTEDNQILVVDYLRKSLPAGLFPLVKFEKIDLSKGGKHSYFSSEVNQ